MSEFDALLKELYELVRERKDSGMNNSYTAALFKKGRSRIAQKVGEEAVETVIAAMKGDKKELIDESADLMFHLFVLLAEADVTLDEVIYELQKRRMKRDNDRD
ncbi:MAG: phosphoribosyl-ATP diphosphatase [Alphaproteobacteria bacterium CG11_big_fil_rev_8_21_14_0_20_44_7]|nr:MAG: phosphoribosyl-ATP diphosphatase [Alphaproteobacteria bacterium CG11_big_fil_rev_8_21_14_0_20_44_7]